MKSLVDYINESIVNEDFNDDYMIAAYAAAADAFADNKDKRYSSSVKKKSNKKSAALDWLSAMLRTVAGTIGFVIAAVDTTVTLISGILIVLIALLYDFKDVIKESEELEDNNDYNICRVDEGIKDASKKLFIKAAMKNKQIKKFFDDITSSDEFEKIKDTKDLKALGKLVVNYLKKHEDEVEETAEELDK